MDKETRKKLQEAYKQRTVVGGVYRIVNKASGRFHIDWDDDIESARKSFAFAAKTGGPSRPDLKELMADWKALGPDNFAFETLEELEKGEDQTREEFFDDLKTLLELWKEKIDMTGAYKK